MFCIICLKLESDLTDINDVDSQDLSILQKIKICVPEVVWKTEGAICKVCLNLLSSAYTFRQLCLKSKISPLEKVEPKNEDFDEGLPEPVSVENYNSDDDIKIETKSDLNTYSCFHCERIFNQKNVLSKHILTEHLNRPKRSKHFECTLCLKQYSSQLTLKKHSAVCKGAPEIQIIVKPEVEEIKTETSAVNTSNECSICHATFTNKYLLKRHVRNVHATEKKFQCDLCKSCFASAVYLNAHKRYHSGDRKHICSFCGKRYITASDLYHHEKIHANKRAYRCEKCMKAFNTSSDLHKHKICVHLDRALWKYECNFCQRKFPLKTNLDTHIKTHTGEKNFPCHLCDRKCINRSVLMRHIDSHSNVKSYKCHICQQGYKYQKSLDIHMTKTHGIGDAKIPERVKKYFCHICPKSYFANNKLQKHLRSHTGDRPFMCHICNKSFIDKSYVKQHLKTAHGVVEQGNLCNL